MPPPSLSPPVSSSPPWRRTVATRHWWRLARPCPNDAVMRSHAAKLDAATVLPSLTPPPHCQAEHCCRAAAATTALLPLWGIAVHVMACHNGRGGVSATSTRSKLSDSPRCEPNTSLEFVNDRSFFCLISASRQPTWKFAKKNFRCSESTRFFCIDNALGIFFCI